MVAFDLLGRRWALRILWELREEHVGFRALQQRCDAMSSSVLRDRLAELTGAALVGTDHAGRYVLSEHGRSLLGALRPLSQWANEWARDAFTAPLSDHHGPGPNDEVVEVASAVPDRRTTEDRVRREVEEPSDVLGVEVAADDVGHLGGCDAVGAQAGEELTANQEIHVVLEFKAESGIDEDDPLA